MPPIWTHKESDPATALATAFNVAAAGSWGAGEVDGVHCLRSLLIASVDTAQALGVNYPAIEGDDPHRVYGRVSAADYPQAGRPDRGLLYMASTILRTPQILCPRAVHVQTLTSVDGTGTLGDPAEDMETGALSGLAVVGIWCMAGAAVVSLAGNASDFVRRMSADANATDLRRMMGRHAAAVQLADSHLLAEGQAGTQMPLSAAERAAIDSLRDVQKSIAQKQGRPLPVPFDGAIDALASSQKNAAAAGGAALVGAGLALAYFLS